MTISLDTIANVSITRATRTASRRSFGVVLIAAYHTAWLDRVRSYTDPADMLTDGFTADHPAYLAAVALVSQNTRVPSFKIGRRAGAPTQTIELTPTDVTEGLVYSGEIGGEAWSYTVQAGDAIDDINVGIAAAINGLTVAVTATPDPASPASTKVIVAADNPGEWFAYTGMNAELDVVDATAEPATTLATDLGAIQTADADWYGLVVADAQSAAQIEAVATWAETQTIVYVAHTMDSDVPASGSADIASTLKAAEQLRTMPFYSRENHGAFPDAAVLGAVLPLTVGSADFEFKTLSGVSADDLSSTEVERLTGTPESPSTGKRAMIYVEAVPTGTNAGTLITRGGLTSGGEWLDVVIGLDYVRALIQERSFNLRISTPKLPFTTGGIDALAGAVRGALRTTALAPYNILDPDSILVEETKLEDVSDADRQARYYDGVRFDARVQGAIRALRIRGTVRP